MALLRDAGSATYGTSSLTPAMPDFLPGDVLVLVVAEKMHTAVPSGVPDSWQYLGAAKSGTATTGSTSDAGDVVLHTYWTQATADTAPLPTLLTNGNTAWARTWSIQPYYPGSSWIVDGAGSGDNLADALTTHTFTLPTEVRNGDFFLVNLGDRTDNMGGWGAATLGNDDWTLSLDSNGTASSSLGVDIGGRTYFGIAPSLTSQPLVFNVASSSQITGASLVRVREIVNLPPGSGPDTGAVAHYATRPFRRVPSKAPARVRLWAETDDGNVVSESLNLLINGPQRLVRARAFDSTGMPVADYVTDVRVAAPGDQSVYVPNPGDDRWNGQFTSGTATVRINADAQASGASDPATEGTAAVVVSTSSETIAVRLSDGEATVDVAASATDKTVRVTRGTATMRPAAAAQAKDTSGSHPFRRINIAPVANRVRVVAELPDGNVVGYSISLPTVGIQRLVRAKVFDATGMPVADYVTDVRVGALGDTRPYVPNPGDTAWQTFTPPAATGQGLNGGLGASLGGPGQLEVHTTSGTATVHVTATSATDAVEAPIPYGMGYTAGYQPRLVVRHTSAGTAPVKVRATAADATVRTTSGTASVAVSTSATDDVFQTGGAYGGGYVYGGYGARSDQPSVNDRTTLGTATVRVDADASEATARSTTGEAAVRVAATAAPKGEVHTTRGTARVVPVAVSKTTTVRSSAATLTIHVTGKGDDGTIRVTSGAAVVRLDADAEVYQGESHSTRGVARVVVDTDAETLTVRRPSSRAAIVRVRTSSLTSNGELGHRPGLADLQLQTARAVRGATTAAQAELTVPHYALAELQRVVGPAL